MSFEIASKKVRASFASACSSEAGSSTEASSSSESRSSNGRGSSSESRSSIGRGSSSEARSSNESGSSSEARSSTETGSSSESGSSSETGSSSEASCSEDQHPTSTTDIVACSSPESDEELSVEEATNKVRRKLIETGQIDRLKDVMERRLSEIGWRKEMMAKCREVVKKNGSSTSFEMLFQTLRQYGKDQVPADVQKDVLVQIKRCYESALKEK